MKFLERDEREIMREEMIKAFNNELKKSLMSSMFKPQASGISMFKALPSTNENKIEIPEL